MKKRILIAAALLMGLWVQAQDSLITNINARKSLSLNGTWQYIVDPYETGFYDYRFKELKESAGDAYWNTDVPKKRTEKKEHGYNDKYRLQVQGDWNHQKPEFVYYEGTIWYKKSFDFHPVNGQNSYYLYFGAVNYRASIIIWSVGNETPVS